MEILSILRIVSSIYFKIKTLYHITKTRIHLQADVTRCYNKLENSIRKCGNTCKLSGFLNNSKNKRFMQNFLCEVQYRSRDIKSHKNQLYIQVSIFIYSSNLFSRRYTTFWGYFLYQTSHLNNCSMRNIEVNCSSLLFTTKKYLLEGKKAGEPRTSTIRIEQIAAVVEIALCQKLNCHCHICI